MTDRTATRSLINYDTNDNLRNATSEECMESDSAAKYDGGCGIITVAGMRCYVDTAAVDGKKFAGMISDTLSDDVKYNAIGDYLGMSDIACCAEYIAEMVACVFPDDDFTGWEVTSNDIISSEGQSQLEVFED